MSSPRSVLLVDDSPIVRAVVAHALGASGLSVTAVDDPRGIEASLAAATPDLLLIDATFPNVTDDMLVDILARHAKSLPVVLFSDRQEAEIVKLVERSGARGFVPKDGATLAQRLEPYFRT